MTQDQQRIERITERANEALRRYADNEGDCSAGFDILRYARMGYLKVEVK